MLDRIKTDNIDAYMQDIKRYDRITVEEENRLANQMATGTEEERRAARDKLICANLRLVVKIAHDFKHMGLGFSDLIAEGNLGLMHAADKFDPTKGAKFSCYAAWWIKQSMRKAVSWQVKTIRVAGGSAHRMSVISKARTRLAAELGREPTLAELSEATGLSKKRIRGLEAARVETCSMCATVNDDSATTFDQMIAETMEDETDRKENKRKALGRAMTSLPDMDRLILSRFYGLDGGAPSTLAALAQTCGMPLEDIQRRMDDALRTLRNLLRTPQEPALI